MRLESFDFAAETPSARFHENEKPYFFMCAWQSPNENWAGLSYLLLRENPNDPLALPWRVRGKSGTWRRADAPSPPDSNPKLSGTRPTSVNTFLHERLCRWLLALFALCRWRLLTIDCGSNQTSNRRYQKRNADDWRSVIHKQRADD